MIYTAPKSAEFKVLRKKMHAKINLLPTKQQTVLNGHPWIFPKAIASVDKRLRTGDLAAVYSAEGELIAVGAYNEHSLYRIRVLALARENLDCGSYAALVSWRLKQAMSLRNALQLPNEKTTAYRLFNSEADGLSGLTIDRFGNVCVVASSAYWVELNREVISQALKVLLPDDTLLWMPQNKHLAKDGWECADAATVSHSTQIVEHGIIYQVEFGQMQKTGLFIDQRDNHRRVAELSKGMRVLDLYTYTGGFALHAAKAGAKQVTAVDSSAQAIAQAQNNAQLNNLDTIEFVEADARDYLVKAGEYDIVILDPPKLVPSQRHIEKAKNYYRFLHREVFKSMRSGTLLMTCNCSSALSPQEFCHLVSAQAGTQGKQARILGLYGPASCHPVLSSFPEGNYLSAVLMAVI